jgi:hypothetical protein
MHWNRAETMRSGRAFFAKSGGNRYRDKIQGSPKSLMAQNSISVYLNSHYD